MDEVVEQRVDGGVRVAGRQRGGHRLEVAERHDPRRQPRVDG
ncbi:hypothetical protein [Baekduia soli]|nr:hypothetical protein [Baekduia soli]